MGRRTEADRIDRALGKFEKKQRPIEEKRRKEQEKKEARELEREMARLFKF